MPPGKPKECPDCKSRRIIKHCDAKNCTWYKCDGCGSYGTDTRWQRGSKR